MLGNLPQGFHQPIREPVSALGGVQEGSALIHSQVSVPSTVVLSMLEMVNVKVDLWESSQEEQWVCCCCCCCGGGVVESR